MCARIKIRGTTYRPGMLVPTQSNLVTQPLLWDGFARSESADLWRKKNAKPATIEAEAFAERHDHTRELVWETRPAKIQALTVGKTVRVVTRPATPAEAQRFGHPRMPQEASA